ncbi:unnamed protein product, partial [Polarella glacialis]
MASLMLAMGGAASPSPGRGFRATPGAGTERQIFRGACFRAAGRGEVALLGQLLTCFQADPRAVDEAGRPLLSWAAKASAEEGGLACLRLLLEASAAPESGREDPSGWTPLFYAAAAGSSSAVQLLISASTAATAVIQHVDRDGCTALFHASTLDCARALLTRQCSVDERDSHGRTPLFHAASRRSAAVVAELLAQRAEASAKDKLGRSPLFYASVMQAAAYFRATCPVVELLLGARACATCRDVRRLCATDYAMGLAPKGAALEQQRSPSGNNDNNINNNNNNSSSNNNDDNKNLATTASLDSQGACCQSSDVVTTTSNNNNNNSHENNNSNNNNTNNNSHENNSNNNNNSNNDNGSSCCQSSDVVATTSNNNTNNNSHENNNNSNNNYNNNNNSNSNNSNNNNYNNNNHNHQLVVDGSVSLAELMARFGSAAAKDLKAWLHQENSRLPKLGRREVLAQAAGRANGAVEAVSLVLAVFSYDLEEILLGRAPCTKWPVEQISVARLRYSWLKHQAVSVCLLLRLQQVPLLLPLPLGPPLLFPVAPLLAPAPVSLTELMLSGSASSSDPPPGPVTGAADTLAEASGASVTAAYVAEADSASGLQNQLLSFEALAFGSQPPPVIDAVNSQPRKLYRLAFHDPITRRPIPPGSKEFFDLLRTLGEDCPETAFHLRATAPMALVQAEPQQVSVVVLPLRDQVIFPLLRGSFEVPKSAYDEAQSLIDRGLAIGIGAIALRPISPKGRLAAADVAQGDLYEIGTLCSIVAPPEIQDGASSDGADEEAGARVTVMVEGVSRFKVLDYKQAGLLRIALVEVIQEPDDSLGDDDVEVRALIQSVQ